MGHFTLDDMKPQEGSNYPESRVLIIMTGGTICMGPSDDGLVPMDDFMARAMEPRPSFNDNAQPRGGCDGTSSK